MRPSTTKDSRQRINRAIDFLACLAERDNSLRTCTQSDVDAWYIVKYATRRPTHAFLSWAMTAGLMPKTTLPQRRTSNPAPMAQRNRLAMIRKLLESPDIPLRERVVGLLVFFYAQPVSRIALLTTNDVLLDEDATVLLRIGDPPTPVPEPLASLCCVSCSPNACRSRAPTPTPPGCSPAAEQANPCGLKHSALSCASTESPSKPAEPPPSANS